MKSGRQPRPAEERFWSHVVKAGPDQCWEWTGHKTHGYGRFCAVARLPILAHRYAYELLVGSIPDGMTIDHVCCNRSCVNPAHMDVVTGVENCHRGKDRRKFCGRGHPFDKDNTYVYKNGTRYCRACHNERMEELRRAAGKPVCRKLSDEQVDAIRRYFARGLATRNELARLFSVSYSHLANIIRGAFRSRELAR